MDALDRAVNWANRHGRGLRDVERFLRRAGDRATFGVEYVSAPDGRELAYLNAGDTYTRTACAELDGGREGTIFAGDWGGWVENAEREHTEDTGEVSCAYCGEWVDTGGREWRTVACECGHYLDGREAPSA